MKAPAYHTYINAEGQVVIPAPVRRVFGMTERTHIRIEIDEAGQRIILIPITRSYVHSLRGKYKGKQLLVALATEKVYERGY